MFSDRPLLSPSHALPALLVDSDGEFLHRLRSFLHYEKVETVFAPLASLAVSHLQDPRQSYSAIYLNPITGFPGGVKLLELARRHRPVTPIYLLYRNQTPLQLSELNRFGIHGAFNKDTQESILLESFLHSRETLELLQSIDPPELSGEGFDRGAVKDPIYQPVPVEEFFSGEKTFHDVFVRLQSGRFLKVLRKEELFAEDRLAAYLGKGVSHFYIERESVERFVKSCQILGETLLKSPLASLDLKLSMTFNRGEGIVDLIRKESLNKDHLHALGGFTSDVYRILKVLRSKQGEGVTRLLLPSMSACEHAVGTMLVASLLTAPLRIESQQAFETVAISALLHDVGLYRLPAIVQTEQEERMSPEERDLYYQHPDLGAQILSDLGGIHPTIIQAVSQHHCRRFSGSFPKNIAPSGINRVAEIVGIADEYVKLLQRRLCGEKIDPLWEMEQEVFRGFSLPVVDAFRKIFLVKKR